MKIQDLDWSRSYTYADYLAWTFEETVELIRGKLFRMSPAPNLMHQRISTQLLTKINNFLGGNPCEVFHAPFDVRLPLPPDQRLRNDQIDTVVQPDISVICDPSKLDARGCLGAPDWIIEIISPGTAKKDVRDKYEAYQFAGVKEYWVVYPVEQHVHIFTLNESGTYEGHQPFSGEDNVSPFLFPSLVLDLSEVFPEIDQVEEPWPDYLRM